ncbi:ABC transporter permease [Auritidibacter ignavus]|uniref:ABC transporter permease n=1 Tax=Auritidibacter ignavus TaxID=678932 RepID=UPI002449C3B1|nr:ABC transporter permease [Auritidibacter ignavus]WGH82930.1 ABC transporter permease [Auritidibacter ignavus]
MTSFAAATIVASREIKTRLRSKAFVITGVILIALVLFGSLFGPRLADSLSANGSSDTTVAISQDVVDASATDQPDAGLDTVPGLQVSAVDDAGTVREQVESGEVDAGVVMTEVSETNPMGVEVLALDEPSNVLIDALSITPQVTLLDDESENFAILYVLGLIFGLVYFMAAITFGQTIATSVVEEKQSRIIEILLAAVPARAILFGKVLGNSVVAFAQIALMGLAAVIGVVVNDGDGSMPLLSDQMIAPTLWFVLFFTISFVMVAGMYAAAASMVSRNEDLGSVSTPIVLLIMIPYFLILAFSTNPEVVAVMSWVPFSAAVAMPLRVFTGDAAIWEVLGSLGVLILTTVLIMALAIRIYQNSILKTGKAVKFREALAS